MAPRKLPEERGGGLQVRHGDAEALEPGIAEWMLTPVVGRFERLDVLHGRGIIMEAAAEELPRHTECLGGMDVDGDTQLPYDPHTPGQDLGTDLIGIGYLVLDADVVGSEAGVQQILRRRKHLEHHAPDGYEARMPVVAGQIAVELRPVEIAQVVDALVEVFHHGVDVVHVQALEGFRHGSAPAVIAGVGRSESVSES